MAFKDVIDKMFSLEGGYVNHPADRGAATNMGITQRTLDNARDKYPHLNLPVDVKDLTRPQATDIYKFEYWNVRTLRLDDIDAIDTRVATILFDMSINSGPGNAARRLQRAVGTNADGIIGPITLAAVANYQGNLAEDFLWYRLDFFYNIVANDSSQQVFMRGWKNRLNRLAEFIGIEGIPQ